jgi:hypothetical protein
MGQFGQPWQLLAQALVIHADDVLNQSQVGQAGRIYRGGPVLVRLRIRQFFQDLIDRKLEFCAGPIERSIGLRAKIDIKALQNSGCRGLREWTVLKRT